MAITFTISDGTITINLSGGDGFFEEYQPQPPDVGADSVTETLDCTLTGGNAAIAITQARLERFFQAGRDRARLGRGITPVYITLQLDATGWRTELYDGKIVPNPNWIRYEWANGQRKINLILTRAPWWELDTAQAVHMTNGNGTNQTSLKVFNCNDGTGSSPSKKNNWVKTNSASEITGDLPAPALISHQNQVANGLDTLMIANNVYSDPANLVTWYEGETGTGDTADAAASNGNYHSFTGASISVTKLITSQAALMEGGAYRVLARLRSTADWKIKPSIGLHVQTSYGPTQTLPLSQYGSFYLWDLGIVTYHQIKNFSSGAPMPYTQIQFGFKADKSGSGTIDVDYLQLTPLDGWRRLSVPVFTANYYITLDESAGKVYTVDDTNTNVVDSGVATGAPILLYPGTENRLHFLWASSTVPESAPNNYGLVSVFYRPRRRAL